MHDRKQPVSDGEVEKVAHTLESANTDDGSYWLIAAAHQGAKVLRRQARQIEDMHGALRFSVGAAINELVARGVPAEWSSSSGIGVALAALSCHSTSLDDAARAALSADQAVAK